MDDLRHGTTRASIAGGALAAASLPLHALAGADASRQMTALTLAVVAAIYVGFALADGRRSIVAREVAVALGFVGAAVATVAFSAWIAVAAFAAHGLWDVAHHRNVDTRMPRWYIPFCAVLDWVFVAGLAVLLSTWKGSGHD